VFASFSPPQCEPFTHGGFISVIAMMEETESLSLSDQWQVASMSHCGLPGAQS
jgi:hypothetical protein